MSYKVPAHLSNSIFITLFIHKCVHQSVHPSIHPPIYQQVFIECLLCSRLFTKGWAYSDEQTDTASILIKHLVQ